MTLHKFSKNDIFRNVIRTHPKSEFFIYDNVVYYNNQCLVSQSLGALGNQDLYELNPGRQANLIYPYAVKGGSLTSFKSISTASFNSDYVYGDKITSSYPYTASISRQYHAGTTENQTLKSFRVPLETYAGLSRDFVVTSSFAHTKLSWVNIPSIFYGSTIKKGSVKMRFHISGTITSELQDSKRNGQLIVVSSSDGPGSTYLGESAGLVLYNHGIILLTGSWALNGGFTEEYEGGPAATPKWFHWGDTGSVTPSSSFSLEFQGTHKIPTLTMLAHSRKGEQNFSNNPTFLKFAQTASLYTTGSSHYSENDKIEVANIVSSSYSDTSASFEKTTYISKIGIFDENRNLIMIAKVANPVRKKERDSYTFKLKMDL